MKIWYSVTGRYANQEPQVLTDVMVIKSGMAESIPITQEIAQLAKSGNLESYEVKIIATSSEE